MKPSAVLLCAGRSTRTYPLTVNRPKPLLSVANMTLLERNLRELEGICEKAVVIVGYEAEQVREFLAGRAFDIPVELIVQERQLGTAHALLQAEGHLAGKFLALNGDVLYAREDLARLASHDAAVLGVKVDDHAQFGMIVSRNGAVESIVEKPAERVSEVANAGAYSFDESIFPILGNVKKSSGQEYYLTDAVGELARTKKVALELVRGYWLHIGYPWDLLAANEFLLEGIEPDVSKEATVEKGATLKGAVVVGKGTLIRAGAYIEGPVVIGDDCVIGPNCYIRPSTSIGDGCKVGNGCEVKNSILFEGAVLSHLCYVGDSIVGRHANLGGGTITANLRHDKQPVRSIVAGSLVSTGRVKFGTAIGDYAKIGIHTSIYPGRKIWPFKSTAPGELVQKDVL